MIREDSSEYWKNGTFVDLWLSPMSVITAVVNCIVLDWCQARTLWFELDREGDLGIITTESYPMSSSTSSDRCKEPSPVAFLLRVLGKEGQILICYRGIISRKWEPVKGPSLCAGQESPLVALWPSPLMGVQCQDSKLNPGCARLDSRWGGSSVVISSLLWC